MNTWIPGSADGALATPYARHSATLRGALRHALVTRALLTHLSERPQRILDVGGGSGVQAVALAQCGHHVTVLDPDAEMLKQAEAAWVQYTTGDGTVECVAGTGEDALRLAGDGWDAVLCHGVLMYVPDPAPLLGQLAACVRPGGLVSVLAKSAASMAMRPALARDWNAARSALTGTAETGRLGVTSRGVDRAAVERVLAGHGVRPEVWYGVRCFTDHLGDEAPGEDFPDILDVEWQAGTVSPYRDVARLWHMLARRRTEGGS